MRLLLFIFPFICCVSLAQQNRSKVEELLIWKVSEDLKLSVKEEKDLSEILRGISQQKQLSQSKMDELVQKLSKAAGEKEKTASLQEYKRQLKMLNDLSIQELELIQKKLGAEKAAEYLVVKSEVATRIRNLLAPQDKSESGAAADGPAKSLPEPKVIEE